jgi:acyl-CoA reductase-like NAD-dependent aldehyde dehydrogenase
MSADRETLLAEVKASGTLRGLPTGHFINGSWVPAAKGRAMESYDPGRGAVFAEFAAGDADDVDQAVSTAKQAFTKTWRKVKPAERGRILMRAADLVRRDARPPRGGRKPR